MRSSPGSDLLTEHRRLVGVAGEHAKQLQAAMPDDLFSSPLRLHVEGLVANLRELWLHGEAWEKDRDGLIDLVNEATEAAA